MSETTKRRVCLGMPGYGQVSAGASRGFWRASKGESATIPLEVSATYNAGSLLAQNFNALWCWALNECHQGRRVDYFAMLHADVEPEDFWLDVLIDELEAKQLDVLGAVVPIKDPHGLTSLALDRDEDDQFRILCRLTMREVFQLPETFTSEDVGHPLLLNTGCWVCKFNPEWARRQVWFTINDRIVFNSKLNLFQAQVEPEDWNFSRQCHALKLKIGATRKVRLGHAGETRFVNDQPWGHEEFDSQYVSESQIPKLLPPIDGWKFPGEVDGWLTPAEGIALAELAKDKRALEIGSYCGRSTICMAQTAAHVHSIDPHDGRATPIPRSTLETLKDNLARYGVDGKVTVHVGTIEEVEAWPGLGEFDLAFIDGAHDLESVKVDISGALCRLKLGGLLVFHDYRERPGQHDGRWDPGVTQAVAELIADGGELLSTHSTLAVVKPPILLEANNG